MGSAREAEGARQRGELRRGRLIDRLHLTCPCAGRRAPFPSIDILQNPFLTPCHPVLPWANITVRAV